MLKKLKNKITIINVVPIILLLLAIYSVVLYHTYSENHGILTQRLDTAIELRQGPGNLPELGDNKHNNMPDKEPTADFYGPAVVVTLNEKDEIIQVSEYYAKISEEALEKILKKALASDYGYDNIPGMQIMYLKKSSSMGTKIAITETKTLYDTMTYTAITGGVICLIVLAVMFGVSILLSSLAIKPVKEAWDKQKQFIADASHELKTPLTVILANNNILQRHREETISSQQQWLDSTEEEATRMKKLLDQMLFLAKSDAAEKPIILSKINISEITQRTVLTFEPVAFEKNVNIKPIIADNLLWTSNAEQFDSLLHILIDNALKHAANNTIVTVALQKNGSRVFLSVNNHGDIIPPEDLPHIFDRFYRVDKSRTSSENTSGYGLGLPIAKNILQSINGDIVVSSNEENGTTFTAVFS